MIRITDALTIEHVTIRTVFSQIENLLATFENVEGVKGLARMVEALLTQHGEVEEQLLYVVLDHALADVEKLECMSQEHGEIDHRLADIQNATELETARRMLRAVMNYSRKHFQNEELNIFPHIHQRISEDALKALGEAWYLKQTIGI
jgi:hemerythrin-like domain-containing protein